LIFVWAVNEARAGLAGYFILGSMSSWLCVSKEGDCHQDIRGPVAAAERLPRRYLGVTPWFACLAFTFAFYALVASSTWGDVGLLWKTMLLALPAIITCCGPMLMADWLHTGAET
jgi:hypothetical protein